MEQNSNQFSFEISLSVLNHLGRNLYRSFMTVLGEAISNAWDADAQNVWIDIDKTNNSFFIKDDGIGMNNYDFQNRFLKIGYSKRKEGKTTSKKNRPYIGRKGIGKLALLSCAERISILTKVSGGEYIGGVIDNSGLDEAITNDLKPSDYPLGKVGVEAFSRHIKNHPHGTIIYFENTKSGIRNTSDYLRKLIALYFRFSLLDHTFNLHVNGELITLDDLDDLANNTQFYWNINEFQDPFVTQKLAQLESPSAHNRQISAPVYIKGFIASVDKPSNLKITTTDEKVSIDLFVNGRLREKDILKHIPSARVVESYLYGQIHFNELDDEIDRFASSREGVVADDPKFNLLLNDVKEVLKIILEDWDDWRIEIKKTGDSENPKRSPKERTARELYNAVSEEYSLPTKEVSRSTKSKVDSWIDDLADDAQFNFSSYAECFISENLLRKYIVDNNIELSPEAQTERDKWKVAEERNKEAGNLSIDIRHSADDLSYLSMDALANLIDKEDPIKKASISRDSKEYKPIRDALAHTARLTDLAKYRLTSVHENIKARVKKLLAKS